MSDKKNVALAEREGSITVTTTVLNETKEKRKKIQIRPFVTNPASVSVKLGSTIPTGDYSSVRIDVMITAPCYIEEVPEMYKKVKKMVHALLNKEVDRLTEEE